MLNILDIVGRKRVMMIVFLGAVIAIMVAANFWYFKQEIDALKQQNRVLTSQVTSKRNDAVQMNSDFMMLEDQQGFFEDLKQAGFFSDQNRLRARRGIVDIQKHTDVMSVTYTISSSEAEETEDTRKADHAILRSNVVVNVEAMDDEEIYKFAWWVENTFPGHVALTNANVVRTRDVDDNTLRAISQDGPTSLIEGQLEFVWQTLMPRADLLEAGVLKEERRY